jgi:plasmid stabilization system protein ParE
VDAARAATSHRRTTLVAREPGVSRLLLHDELARVGALISENPAIGVPVRGRGARRLVLPRPSYVLFYRVRPRLQRIEVVAFVHGSRGALL